MSRLDLKFAELRKLKKKAFIAFITGGYPDLDTTLKLILEFNRIGVDIIEIGVPFSDPMADGPVIQAASQYALKKNVHLADILNMVKLSRQYTDIPICLMSYYNPIFCFGEEAFVRKARSSGVDGVIVPDLPPEEAVSLRKAACKSGLDTIFFIAPTTSRERIRFVTKVSTGFIYYVSLTGVTGARQRLPADISTQLKMIKRQTDKPVCVGFGISSAAQAKALQRVADGVIVGSAIVKSIREHIGHKGLVSKVGAFVSSLKGR